MPGFTYYKGYIKQVKEQRFSETYGNLENVDKYMEKSSVIRNLTSFSVCFIIIRRNVSDFLVYCHSIFSYFQSLSLYFQLFCCHRHCILIFFRRCHSILSIFFIHNHCILSWFYVIVTIFSYIFQSLSLYFQKCSAIVNVSPSIF